MAWCRERQRGNNIILSFGPYVTPARRRTIYWFFQILIGAIFLGAFIFFVELYSSEYRIYKFFSHVPFAKFEWIVWMTANPMQIGIGAFALIYLFSLLSKISGRIAFLLIGEHGRVILTPEKIRVRKFRLFWRSCPRKENMKFELVLHPKSGQNDIKEIMREEKINNIYLNTGIVIIRCGTTKIIKVAVIYDWKDFKLGHKASQLVVTLQTALNKTVEQPKESKKTEEAGFFGGDDNLD